MNPHQILGVSNNASEDEIKKAYRRMAMQHHPDRGGKTEDFQRIQTAYSTLEASGFRPFVAPRSTQQQRPNPSWSKPESPGGTWRDRNETIDDIFDQMKKANRGYSGASDKWTSTESDDIVARVGIREAFSGFNMEVDRRGAAGGVIGAAWVNIPPGTPDGYRGKYTLSNGQTRIITTAIDPGKFTLRGFSNADNIFSAGMNYGDMEMQLEVDAIDLITGSWVNVKDFLGETLTVRIPAGFNPLHRLKLANKGYYGWDDAKSVVVMRRQDLYIKLTPLYKTPAEIDRKKILDLYNAKGGWDES